MVWSEGKIFWNAIVLFVIVSIILSFVTTNDAIWIGALIVIGSVAIWKLSKQIGRKSPWKAFYMSALLSVCLLGVLASAIALLEDDIDSLITYGILVGTYLFGGVVGYLLAKYS